MSLLDDLFTRYGTDKNIWGYTEAYEKHLGAVRDKVACVLEIGICGFRDIPNNVVGASLFAWRDYFPDAEINGIDNDGRFIFNDQERIHTALCDAYGPDLESAVKHLLDASTDYKFDFICDDAVHDPLPQMHLVRKLWPYLCRNGVYAIEEACPYKVPNSNLGEHVILPLMREFEDMTATEYQTHKDERLLILRKSA